jgi:hypothetical protein
VPSSQAFRRQRLQRGKLFNVSSEHFIVGTRGKDMPAAMRPKAVGGKDVLRETSPPWTLIQAIDQVPVKHATISKLSN